VVKAKPDGYTLLMPTSSTGAINPVVYPEMRFNPVTDRNGHVTRGDLVFPTRGLSPNKR
jgi:hypothetical protein